MQAIEHYYQYSISQKHDFAIARGRGRGDIDRINQLG